LMMNAEQGVIAGQTDRPQSPHQTLTAPVMDFLSVSLLP
jgi:hypothetical protein